LPRGQAQAEALGLRVEVDTSGQRLAKQIRTAEQERIPVMAVVGMEEKNHSKLALRSRKAGDLGTLDLPFALSSLQNAVSANIELHELEGITVIPRAVADEAPESGEDSKEL